jgi:hypothetical protein
VQGAADRNDVADPHADRPDLLAIAEHKPLAGYVLENWFGLFAPANTPADVVQRVHAAVGKALQSPDLVKRLREQGAEPAASATPLQLGEFVQTVHACGVQAREQDRPAMRHDLTSLRVFTGLADFGIFGAHTPARGLETLPYHRDRLAVAVPEGHPGEAQVAAPHRLLSHEFIAPHSSSSLFVLRLSDRSRN